MPDAAPLALTLLLLPALAVFLLSYAPLYLPRPLNIPPNAPHLSVMTYNLGAIKTQTAPLIDVIRAMEADVVALQELSATAAPHIAAALAEVYPYQALNPHENGFDGHGILSRYPLHATYSYPYSPMRLRLQRVMIEFEGNAITLYNAHPQPITESWRAPDVLIQRQQIAYLVEEASKQASPRLLLGDFNTNEQSSDYQGIIRAGFADAHYTAGWGMGFTNPVWSSITVPDAPAWLALIPVHRRIDFVFYDSAFTAIQSHVWPDAGGSDHYPVYAQLALVE